SGSSLQQTLSTHRRVAGWRVEAKVMALRRQKGIGFAVNRANLMVLFAFRWNAGHIVLAQQGEH
ncbi:MAG: hypothetical protein M3121_06630, partial [Chloroflexota bacterium]|nr:hypothetical protein [Chloroflexota bacterium]